jgi:hypothetical protein
VCGSISIPVFSSIPAGGVPEAGVLLCTACVLLVYYNCTSGPCVLGSVYVPLYPLLEVC